MVPCQASYHLPWSYNSLYDKLVCTLSHSAIVFLCCSNSSLSSMVPHMESIKWLPSREPISLTISWSCLLGLGWSSYNWYFDQTLTDFQCLEAVLLLFTWWIYQPMGSTVVGLYPYCLIFKPVWWFILWARSHPSRSLSDESWDAVVFIVGWHGTTACTIERIHAHAPCHSSFSQ